MDYKENCTKTESIVALSMQQSNDPSLNSIDLASISMSKQSCLWGKSVITFEGVGFFDVFFLHGFCHYL